MDSTEAQMIFNVIMDVLKCLKVPFANIRGQYHGGALVLLLTCRLKSQELSSCTAMDIA